MVSPLSMNRGKPGAKGTFSPLTPALSPLRGEGESAGAESPRAIIAAPSSLTEEGAEVRVETGRKLFEVLALVIGSYLLLCFSAWGAQDSLALAPVAQVDSEGIFLSQLLDTNGVVAVPQLRLGDAPKFGQTVTLSRPELTGLTGKAGVPFTNFSGAETIRITRRSKVLNEAEIKELLRNVLQQDHVGQRGELELNLTRPWAPVLVPDEALTLKIVSLPSSGISASFVARFELHTGREVVGTWQAPLQAKIWRDVWVARSALRPGQLFGEADLSRERRDVLTLREAPVAFEKAFGGSDLTLEIAETIPAGSPLYLRAVRLRPVIHRGELIEALVRDGSMVISLKVEALESGAPGQIVRVRNLQSRKELRGKVQNDQTILVSL